LVLSWKKEKRRKEKKSEEKTRQEKTREEKKGEVKKSKEKRSQEKTRNAVLGWRKEQKSVCHVLCFLRAVRN